MSRGWQAFWLATGALACLAVLPLAAAFAVMSPLVFYADSDLSNPLAWAAFLLFQGFWIALILGPLGAWLAFSRGRTAVSWTAMACPAAWGGLVAITLWLLLR
jgi:hypothetical protein